MSRPGGSAAEAQPHPEGREPGRRPRLAGAWRHAIHLVRRFFEVARPEPLAPAEQRHVAGLLGATPPEVVALFWSQSPADQRHAYATMLRSAAATTDHDVLVAALLHDVGKGTIRIGAVARSIATLLDMVNLPMTASMRAYRNHGPSGAALLETAGAPALAIDFARRHPDPDPGAAGAAQWRTLLAADDA